MKMQKMRIVLCVILCVAVISVSAQTDEFKYQGSLSFGGQPANGNFDFEFSLFGSLAAGTQIGSTLTRANVPVINGSFSVALTFGDSFPGAHRYLEIKVRPAGGGAYILLTPRQQVLSTPYALTSQQASVAGRALEADFAKFAGGANAAITADTATNALALGGLLASQYVVGNDPRLTDARTPTAGSSNYIQNQNGVPQNGNFSITGNGVMGGNLAVGNGSATNPSLSFGSDTNTGIFRSGPDTLNLSTNGVSRIQVDQSGNTSFSGNITIPATTRYVNVSAAGFIPQSNAMGWGGTSEKIGVFTGEGMGFTSALMLPHGSTVTELQAIVRDNDATRNINVSLLRYDPLSSSLPDLLASLVSSGVSTNRQSMLTSNITSPNINNQTYSYILYCSWVVPPTNTDIALYSVRVTYTANAPLP